MAWGDNSKGQCGVPPGASPAIPRPVRVHPFDGTRLLHVSAGSKHSAVVQEGGTLCTFGHGRFGRLGIGFEPDTQAPSAVEGALRGQTVVQAACGTAHTLALSVDGRVYAFGYNGRRALGGLDPSDTTDRLAPAQVTGLHPCVAVAAGAASMAVGCAGEVYVWGDCAPLGAAAGGGGAAGRGEGAAQDRERDRRHVAVAWLAGRRARALACGVEGAAVVTEEKELVLLGNRSNMPPSLRALARARREDEQQIQEEEGQQPAPLLKPQQQQPLQQQQQQQQQQGVQEDPEEERLGSSNGSVASSSSDTEQDQAPFDPETEAAEQVACGEAHFVVLCRPTEYVPAVSEVREALLEVLNAYMRSCSSGRESASLPLGLAAAGWGRGSAGSVWGGGSAAAGASRAGGGSEVGTRALGGRYRAPSTIVSLGLPRRPGYAGSVMSSAYGRRYSSGGGDSGGDSTDEPGTPAVAPKRLGPRAAARDGNPPGTAKAVSWNDAAVVEEPPALGTPQALLQSTPEHQQQQAGSGKGGLREELSVAAAEGPRGTTASKRGWGGGSVLGGRGGDLAGDGPPDAVAAGLTGSSLGASSSLQEIGLHGIFLLCREIGLVDDLTEYSDIRSCFRLMLHRKLGRLGPAHTRKQTKSEGSEADNEETTRDSLRRLCSGREKEQHSESDGEGDPGGEGSGLPERMVFVPVVRPGSPALPAAASAAAEEAATSAMAAAAGRIQASLGRATPACAAAAAVTVSSAALGLPRPASRSSGSPAVGPTTLEAVELLELLLLLVRERHPPLRHNPEALLRLLARRYVLRLQGRQHDKGPPWLLRQVLQPEIINAFEGTSEAVEQLHAVYVHLAGGSSNLSDLELSLADMRLGLKQAAMAPEAAQGVLHDSAPQAPQRDQDHAWGKPRLGLTLGAAAAFLRSAGLVPRLFAHYIAQLQRKADHSGGQGGKGGAPLVMPSLRMRLRGGAAELGPLGGHLLHMQQGPGGRRRSKGAEASGSPLGRRMTALLELERQQPLGGSRASNGAGVRGPLSRSTTRRASGQGFAALRLAGGGSGDGSSIGALGSPDSWRAAPGAPSPPPGWGPAVRTPIASDEGACEGGFREGSRQLVLRQGSLGAAAHAQGRRAGAPAAAASRRGSRGEVDDAFEGTALMDSSLLDDAELCPARSRRASFVFEAEEDATRDARSSSAGGSGDGGGGGGGGGGTRWRLVMGAPALLCVDLPMDQPGPGTGRAPQRGLKARARVAAAPGRLGAASAKAPGAAGGGRAVAAKDATYQQQQAALKTQKAAAELDAAAATEQERRMQDTWLVFVLAELLGSFVVGPSSSPVSSITSGAVRLMAREGSAADAAASLLRSPEQQQQQRMRTPTGSAIVMESPGAGSPALGRRFTGGGGGTGGDLGGLGAGGGGGGAVSLDLMSARISYPQFVELLLVCAAVRMSGVLDLAIKALAPLTLDAELKEHLRTVSNSVRRWRDKALAGRVKEAGAAGTGNGAVVGCRAEGDLCQTVKQCYGLYSCLDTHYVYSRGLKRRRVSGESGEAASRDLGGPTGDEDGRGALALDLPAFMRLLQDARICYSARRPGKGGRTEGTGENDGSYVSRSQCTEIFEGLVSGSIPVQPPPTTAAKKTKKELSPERRGSGDIGATRTAVGGGEASGAGALRRQSTFMRSVAAHRLAQLGVDPERVIRRGRGGVTRPGQRQQKRGAARPAKSSAVLNASSSVSHMDRGQDSGGSGSSDTDSDTCASGSDSTGDGGSGEQDKQDEAASSSNQTGARGSTSNSAGLQGEETDASASGATSSTDSGGATGSGGTDSPCDSDDDSGPARTAQQGKAAGAKGTGKRGSDGKAAVGVGPDLSDTTGEHPQAASSAAGGPGGHGGRGPTHGRRPEPARPCLTLHQFGEAVRRLATAKFPGIANKLTAWRLLVERDIKPAVQRRRNRFDDCSAALQTPGVVALLQAWREDMETLVQAAAAIDAADGVGAVAVGAGQEQQARGRPASQEKAPDEAIHAGGDFHGPEEQHQLALSFRSLFVLLQDREAIPQLLQPGDAEEALRRVDRTGRLEDRLVSDLTPSEFLEALAMLGLSVFQSRRLRGSFSRPEQQLAAFFVHIGLPPLPAHEELMAQGGGGGVFGGAVGAGMGGGSGAGQDSYAEWWGMEFGRPPIEPAPTAAAAAATGSRGSADAVGSGGGATGDYMSSCLYNLVLLQETAMPPRGCPPPVLRLLEGARSAHALRHCDEVLRLLCQAQDLWEEGNASSGPDCSEQSSNCSLEVSDWLRHSGDSDRDEGCGHDSSSDEDRQQRRRGARRSSTSRPRWRRSARLAPAMSLFFGAASCGVLLTAGRDEEAREALLLAAPALQWLHEAGADAAAWHGSAGVVAYHLGDLQAAFEHFVRCLVIRQECSALGPQHVDTAAAAHNLGCVLDRLGNSERALRLLDRSRDLMAEVLGQDHPRTLVAARNTQRVRHRAVRLPAAAAAVASRPQGGATSDNHEGGAGEAGSEGEDELGPGPGAAGGGTDSGLGGGQSSTQARLLAAMESRRRRGGQGAPTTAIDARGDRGAVHRRSGGPRVWGHDYTDVDHIGGGIYEASSELRHVYATCRADVAAHAAAASSHPSALEMQVLPSTNPGPAFAFLAPSWPPAVLAKSGGRAASGAFAAAPQAQTPALMVLRRGPLGDATVAAVAKPASAEERREARRTAGKKAGAYSVTGQPIRRRERPAAALLDKLFGKGAGLGRLDSSAGGGAGGTRRRRP